MDNPLLNVNEVANLLKVSPTTVWRLVKRGALAKVTVQGRVRFEVEAVRQFVEANTVRQGG